MAKKSCVVCYKDLGFFSMKTSLSDGMVCKHCLLEAGMVALNNPTSYSANSMKLLVNRRKQLVESFKSTKNVGKYIFVDENSKTFKIGNDLFEYSNLLSFELLEDGESISKGGLGRAVAGGLLFGGLGAIVGGVTGGKKTKGVCTSLKICLTLKNSHKDTVYINFITTETKTKGTIYKLSQTLAQECLATLQIIADINNTDRASIENKTSLSVADEIFKLKQLIDLEIITEDEFEAKKKQLLGL